MDLGSLTIITLNYVRHETEPCYVLYDSEGSVMLRCH